VIFLGFGVAWVAYGIAYTGWVMIRGYDIPLSEIWAPVNYYQGSWPPPKMSGTQIWPSKSAGKTTTEAV